MRKRNQRSGSPAKVEPMTAASDKLSKFSVSKAHKAQILLSKKVVSEDRLPEKILRVAGVDVAYAGESAIGAVAVLDYESLELLEQKTATCTVRLPYFPTLLSFREIPPAMACIRKLNLRPDVFLVDGQGIAHPYRCGFASHLGLALGKPAVGVAKSRLVGRLSKGYLVEEGEIIGSVVETKEGSKPVYVSVGHLVSLKAAVKIVRHCARFSRTPEPLLKAHKIAKAESEEFNRFVNLQNI